jgi:hypothetical protein
MEKLKAEFDAPTKGYHPRTKESLKWKYHIEKAKRIEDLEERKRTLKKYVVLQRLTPSKKVGPHSKRLMYIRYADNWVVAINGSYTEVEVILERIRTFCNTSMRLPLSDEKTRITNSYIDKILFLGTYIRHAKYYIYGRGIGGMTKRIRRGLLLTAPLDRVKRKLTNAGFLKDNRPKTRQS